MRKLKLLGMQGATAKIAVTTLALGGASAAVVFGSQASWTAQTTNTGNTVTAGTLTMTNNHNAAAVITATNMKPGTTGSGTVTVTNTGSLPMSVALTQDTLSNGFTAGKMQLNVHDDTRDWCYWPTTGAGACATYGAWDGSATMTGLAIANSAGGAQWPAAQAHTFTVAYQLDSTSPNADQGKSASFRLVWDGTP